MITCCFSSSASCKGPGHQSLDLVQLISIDSSTRSAVAVSITDIPAVSTSICCGPAAEAATSCVAATITGSVSGNSLGTAVSLNASVPGMDASFSVG